MKLTEFCHLVEGTNTYKIVIPSVVVLPVLPAQRRKTFRAYGLSEAATKQLITDKHTGDFLIQVIEKLHGSI